MNQTQPYEEHIITVKGTLRWLAGGVRLILLLALAGALIAGGLQAGKQYKKAQAQKELPDTIEKEVKVKVDESEYYNVKSLVEYEEIVKDKQEYLDESILMKIDPMHKWVGSMRISFLFEEPETEEGVPQQVQAHDTAGLANLYAGKLREQESLERLKADAGIEEDASYLTEILAAEVSSAPGTVGITFSYYDGETLVRLMNAVEALLTGQPELGLTIGETCTLTAVRQEPNETVDVALLDSQASRKADMINYQNAVASKFSLLTDAEKEYLELYRDARNEEGYEEGQTLTKTKTVKKENPSYLKSFVKSGVKGFVITLAACFAAGVFIYTLSPVVLSADSFNDLCGIRVLARIKKEKDMQEKCRMVADLVADRKQDGSTKLAVISSRKELLESPVAKCLLQQLAEGQIPVVTAYEIDKNAVESGRLKDITEVFMIEGVGKSKNRRIIGELRTCRELKIPVDGAVLI